MKKIDELTNEGVIAIIKAFYARHGRNWDDFTYEPKISEGGSFEGFTVYDNRNEVIKWRN